MTHRQLGLRAVLAMALASALACGDDDAADTDSGPGVWDGGSNDAGAPFDAGNADAGHVSDSGPDADAGPEPIGMLIGACGELDDELTSPEPSYFSNTFDFGPEGWTAEEAGRLSQGARDILEDGTAGGNPGYSEAFAFEALARCEGATLIKSEVEIVYDTPGPITDILVEIDGEKIGVSVTRAVTVTGPCMRVDTFDEAAALELLMDKLGDIPLSTANVSAEDRWVKQILFVFADTAEHAATLQRIWDGLDATLRSDTIVWVSVSEGEDAFVYFEDRC